MGLHDPKVSVAMLCGNHEKYLAAAINSVLRQVTDFSFEIVIGDTGSTDGSRQLLRALESEHPEQVRVLYGGQEIKPNRCFASVLDQCRGRYVALLECDDFWSDETKLQQQSDYLDRNPQCAICCHPVRHIDEDGFDCSSPSAYTTPATGSLDDLLQEPFICSSSAVVRAGLIDSLPAWYLRLDVGDWPWFLLNAKHGDIGLIDQAMSVHRHHAGRLWHSSDQAQHYRNMILALRHARQEFDHRFQRQVDLRLSEFHRLISIEMDKPWLPDVVDRHRRMCFLYGGWSSQLPLPTRISHAIRPCRFLHMIAVAGVKLLKAPKRHTPFVTFLLSTIWRQPSWLLRMGRAFVTHGTRGLNREWRTLDYLFGIGQQQYTRWVRLFDTLTDADREAIDRRIEEMQIRPTFSIIIPVHNPSASILGKAIESVVAQRYPDWELCIADDCSDQPHVRKILDEFQSADVRIRCRHSEVQENISAASNAALELATGEFVTFLDHDDELAEHALYMVAEEINRYPQADLIYSDEDRLDFAGRRECPYFKTDWNPDLLLSQNMVCHLAVFRRQLILESGGLRIGFEGSQDHDLVLRCSERTSEDRIRHIPAVLYHWRRTPGSVSREPESAAVASDAGARAIGEHLSRRNVTADVEVIVGRGSRHYRVRYALPSPPPFVSIIIPTKDRVDLLRQCIDGLLKDTDYGNMEIIVVNHESEEPATQEYFDNLKRYESIRVLKYEGAFNYSAINNFAVRESKADILCLLNNDTEITHSDWLTEMVSHAVRNEIGAVGAKLLYPDDSIQHAGVLIGYGGGAGHTFCGLPIETPAELGRLEALQNVSCVTAACMVLRKSIYEAVGGFDEKLFAVGYNDVDLCLRIRSAGYRIMWTPYARLYHHESASRGNSQTAAEQDRDLRERYSLRRRWSRQIASDPNLNQNISIDHLDYRPAFPPRIRRPWC